MPYKDIEKRKANQKKNRQKPENKEYMRLYHIKWKESHRANLHVSERKSRVKRLYNITEEEYKRLVEEQNNLCKLCSGPPDYGRKNLCIDHDHKTGRVRGLICVNCNFLLGHAKDVPEVLDRAAAYLRRQSSP